MSIQIIDDPGFGGRLGAAFGTGIQQAASSLAQAKMKEMLDQRKANAFKTGTASFLEKSLGASPEVAQQAASFLSVMDPQERKYLMSNPDALRLLMQGPPAQQQQQQLPPQAMDGLAQQQQMPMDEAQQAQQEYLSKIGVPEYKMDPLTLGLQPESLQMQQQAPQMQQQVAPEQDKIDVLADAFKSPEQKRREQELELKKASLLEKKDARAENIAEKREMIYKADYDKAAKKASNADNQIRTVDQMIDLSKSGRLNHPAFVRLLEKTGTEWLLSPESQAFKSLSKEFFKSLKDLFGSRPLGIEFEAFKEQFPSLMQTDEGKQMVGQVLKYNLGREKLDVGAIKNVLKKDKNLSPLSFSNAVSEERERLGKDFARNQKKQIFESQVKSAPDNLVGVWDDEKGEGKFFVREGK